MLETHLPKRHAEDATRQVADEGGYHDGGGDDESRGPIGDLEQEADYEQSSAQPQDQSAERHGECTIVQCGNDAHNGADGPRNNQKAASDEKRRLRTRSSSRLQWSAGCEVT